MLGQEALVDRCEATDRGLMVELLVPPRPHHVRDDGIAADVWKIEGLDRREDCERVAAAAGAPCVVLGRDADTEAVDRWLRVGAGVEGFDGFAIGRSIWWEPLRGFFAGELAEGTAVGAIADAYAHAVTVFLDAR